MSNIAIHVQGVGKQYRIGGQQTGYRTFRESLTGLIKSSAGWIQGKKSKTETFWALDDVSFEVKQGEAIGIIGRNGAGKSTLLKILSRITKPTKGRVELYGRVASLLEVGTGFHPELTGRDNIYLNGAILGMSRVEINRKFDEIVEFSGVERFLDTPVKHYSSGMYVRLAFAVAAHLEPEILVVDEVLAVGDAEFQKKCLGKMEDVAHGGRTVLFVSHNMSAIGHLCQNAVWIDQGRLQMQDTSNRVISAYLLSGTTTEGQVQWANGLSQPGVTEFKFTSIRIVDETGISTSTLDIGKPFWIEISYTINETLPYCRVGINVYSDTGEVVFEAYDSDDVRHSGQREPGDYVSRCKLPGNFFNAKRYFVSVHAGIPNVKYLAGAEYALAVDIENIGDLSQMLGLKREGIVFPKLVWEVIRNETE
ncbi:MAG: ABC transporter ATP-binding protein [Anaerolineales bacterium]|nr:ABC transporter ATP-binding protein [Anaerolineales bacterium]